MSPVDRQATGEGRPLAFNFPGQRRLYLTSVDTLSFGDKLHSVRVLLTGEYKDR
jgi:hypothetical protein